LEGESGKRQNDQIIADYAEDDLLLAVSKEIMAAFERL